MEQHKSNILSSLATNIEHNGSKFTYLTKDQEFEVSANTYDSIFCDIEDIGFPQAKSPCVELIDTIDIKPHKKIVKYKINKENSNIAIQFQGEQEKTIKFKTKED